MTMLGLITKIAVMAMGAVLLVFVVTAPQFDDNGAEAAGLSSGAFAEAILVDYAFPLVITAVLLAMAMVGAAYLVRDERLENLERDAGWEDES